MPIEIRITADTVQEVIDQLRAAMGALVPPPPADDYLPFDTTPSAAPPPPVKRARRKAAAAAQEPAQAPEPAEETQDTTPAQEPPQEPQEPAQEVTAQQVRQILDEVAGLHPERFGVVVRWIRDAGARNIEGLEPAQLVAVHGRASSWLAENRA